MHNGKKLLHIYFVKRCSLLSHVFNLILLSIVDENEMVYHNRMKENDTKKKVSGIDNSFFFRDTKNSFV